jgi:hypothetical protein
VDVASWFNSQAAVLARAVGLALALGVATSACPDPGTDKPRGCRVDGQTVDVGESVQVDCNECVCTGALKLECSTRNWSGGPEGVVFAGVVDGDG